LFGFAVANAASPEREAVFLFLDHAVVDIAGRDALNAEIAASLQGQRIRCSQRTAGDGNIVVPLWLRYRH
jgi:hypothetical protein